MNLMTIMSALQSGVEANQFNDYLLLGYAVMLAIFMIYILSVFLRQRNVERDLELLDQILQEDDEYTS